MKAVWHDVLLLSAMTIVCGGLALPLLLQPAAIAGLVRLLAFC